MFVLIEVDLDYDHINGVEFVARLEKREDAQAIINGRKAMRASEIQIRNDYIDQYMANFKYPEMDNGAWINYVKAFPVSYSVTREDFKKSLTQYLKSHQNHRLAILSNYNPPMISTKDHNSLFIVEVP